MNFEKEYVRRVEEAQRCILAFLPEESGFQKTVLQAMNYSVRSGGKRLRPVIMKAAFEMCGGNSEAISAFMAALEMIHTYSLVHDDLPEMDNDELRRGQPTTHVKYGQAMAVLAGDALLNYAYETIHSSFSMADEKDWKNCVEAMTILGKKAGIYGMVGGQCLDVEAEKKGMALNEEQLHFVYENKTAALLQAALECGAALAGASELLSILEKAGYDLGMAFQLQDDILDVEGNVEEFGKPIGSDERNGKKTYLAFMGIEKAKDEQKRLSEEAASLILGIETKNAEQEDAKQFLAGLIRYLTERQK